jgi:MFS family permease
MPPNPTPFTVNNRPTHTRHWVLAFAAALAVITYIDRVCMSQAKPYITTDLALTSQQMGWVFSAFGLAYALFEIPGGWLGDKIGPRKVLLRVVIMWSFFTAATGRAWNLISLLITQFLFGAGEAGAFPNLAKSFTNWLPARERSRAVSTMWLCTRWGGAVTPLLVVAVISLVGWRWAFAVFAVPGLVWAAVFFWWFRDQPRDHPGVNPAELALIEENRVGSTGHVAVPWAKILRSRTVWLLFVQYFCFGYGWYFYITWLPTYLLEVRGADFKTSPLLAWVPNLLGGHYTPATIKLVQAALLAGIPLFFGGFACVLSTWLANRLAERGHAVVNIRRGLAYVGYWGAASMLLVSTHIADPAWAMLAMGLASFSLDLTLPICWRTAMDVGGKYAGTISGTMNMAGQIGGDILGPSVVGFILDHLNRNWSLTFAISAAIYVVGGLCWIWIDPVTPVEQSAPAPKPA